MLRKLEDTVTFRLVRTVASGGMGTVYEARQIGAEGFEKRVAIKTILTEFCDDRRFVELFIQEAKLVADLVHENIVQIYQFGQTADEYYIVMEYINGLSLAEFTRLHMMTEERVPEPLAVFIASRIARGLAYAHSRVDRSGTPMGIVHRDVCPNNILVTTEGLPKLGDFGIAKAANHSTRARGGKRMYMSPEQAAGAALDFRSDIYSLGLVLFELLALRSARARWHEDVHEAAIEGRVDWDLLPAEVSSRLRGILQCMLQTDPLRRYGSTDQLAYELEYTIYHEGYGPTVVTLENYLRDRLPGLYAMGAPQRRREAPGDTIVIPTRIDITSTKPS
ncbi:MAG: serine/threonine protein kinase [Lentisphaeria bacterium]|nr:serine/threonine protein kinase [Lentisphaeria bacterium]